MPTVLHTGKELYGNETIDFSPGDAIKSAANLELQLTDYAQKIKQQREQELLKLIDVNTDNLLLEQFQTEAQKIVDSFVDEAKNLWKNKNGFLSTEDKLALLKKKNELTNRVGSFRAKAAAYLQAKEEFTRRRHLYDPDETMESFKNFLNNPIENDVPSLVPAYKNPDIITVGYLNKVHPWSPQSYEKQIGDRRVYARFRDNIESEEEGKRVLAQVFDSNEEVQRSIIKEMKEYGIKDKTPKDYYIETRLQLTLPDTFFKPATSSRGYGGGRTSKVPIAFANNALNFSSKEPITLADGTVASINGMAFKDNQVFVSMLAVDPNTQVPLSFETEEDARAALAAMPGYSVSRGSDGKYFLAKKSYYPIGQDMSEVDDIIDALSARYRNKSDVINDLRKFRRLYQTKINRTQKPAKQKKTTGIKWG